MVRFYNREELELLNQEGLGIYLDNLEIQIKLAESRLNYLRAQQENVAVRRLRDVTHLTEAAKLARLKKIQEEEWIGEELKRKLAEESARTINDARKRDGLPSMWPVVYGDTNETTE